MTKDYVGIKRYSIFIRVFILVCNLFRSKKKVWHKPEVRLIYGYSVAIFNLVAVLFFSISSLKGEMDSLDSFAFGFLHTMVAVVMLTLVKMSQKLEDKSSPTE